MSCSRKRSPSTKPARAANFESLHQFEVLGSFRLAADSSSAAGALEFRASESRSASSLTTFQEGGQALVGSRRQQLSSSRQRGRRGNALDMDRHARGVRHDHSRLRPQGYTFICGHIQGQDQKRSIKDANQGCRYQDQPSRDQIPCGQYQDRPTSRSQPRGVKVRIDPPQGHNRGGQGQDRPTSRSQPDGVKVRIDPPQGHNPMGSRSGSTHLKVTTEGGQGQDRPTSRSQPRGVKVRIDPPQGHNRGGSRSGSTHLKVTTEGVKVRLCHRKMTVLRRLLRYRRPWHLVNRQEPRPVGNDDGVAGVVIGHRVRGDAVQRCRGHTAV